MAQRPIRVDVGVGQFAGESCCATLESVVDDEAASDACCGELEVDRVLVGAAGAELVLGDRGEVGIVLDQ